MFHHQCNMNCGEKVLATNLSISRKCHDIKAKMYVPVNVWRWLSHLNSLTLTALACTSLSTSSFKSAACISCLDHERLQASKLRTSMRTNTIPDMVGSFPFFDAQTTSQVLRTPNRQTIVSHDHIVKWKNNSNNFCWIISWSLVFSCCLIADRICLFQDNYIFGGIWLTMMALVYTECTFFIITFTFQLSLIRTR